MSHTKKVWDGWLNNHERVKNLNAFQKLPLDAVTFYEAQRSLDALDKVIPNIDTFIDQLEEVKSQLEALNFMYEDWKHETEQVDKDEYLEQKKVENDEAKADLDTYSIPLLS